MNPRNNRAWLLLLAFGLPPAAAADTPLAQVGGSVINAQDFARSFNVLAPEAQLGYSTEQGKEQFLAELINRQLLLQEAMRRGITQRPDVQQLIADASAQIIVVHLLDELKNEVTLSSEDARAYYDAHPNEFRIGGQLRLRQILVQTGGSVTLDAAKTKAEKLAQLVAAGADFAALAKQVSDDKTSADNGGDLGLLNPDQLDGALAQLAESLPVGEVGGPVKTAAGYHLIKVEEKSAGELPAFEFVETKTHAKALAAKQARVVTQWLAGLRQNAQIEIHRDALQAIKLKSAQH